MNNREKGKLIDDNSKLIEDMKDNREALDKGRQLKEHEIDQYVKDHKLEGKDLQNDKEYQDLLNERNDLKDKADKLDYNIARLDEDNKQLAAETGRSYDSLIDSDRPEKYESDTYIPEGLDYEKGSFDDEPEADRAGNEYPEDVNKASDRQSPENTHVNESDKPKTLEESLDKFNDPDWQNKRLDEKQKDINDLIDLQSESLDLKEKPKVQFENNTGRNAADYKPETGEISVHNNSLNNGKDVAESISNECRKAYQNEHGTSPLTQTDVDFRKDQNNRVDSSNDYEAYKNQSTVKDSDDYSRRIRNWFDREDR